jgi:myo-inositol-1(or 4)-monophosphatase
MLNIAEIAAQAAAEVATDFIQDAGIVSSREKDIKTLADEKMNEVILSHLLPTGIPIISEESDSNGASIPSQCWIIDPLDGTFNFTRAYPFYGVSVSLWENDGPVIGVVKDISNSISYSAEKSNGAQMNGKPIHVSSTNKLSNAVLTTGFPSGGDYSTDYLLAFVSSIQKFKKVRAIGSAALMLCHVAQGICDVYYENDIYLWDVAAGLLLVKEAGGKIYLRRKGNTWKYEVLASNAEIFEEASALLIK